MTELQKVAVGRVVIRAKERLVAIRPLDGMLCVETMRYADEIVDREQLDGIPGEEIEVNERELAMATQLVETLSGDFEPEKYHDEYREQLLELIDQKAAGQEIVAQPEPEAPAKVLDLMAALEASLQAGGSRRRWRRATTRTRTEAATASRTTSRSRPRKAAEAKAREEDEAGGGQEGAAEEADRLAALDRRVELREPGDEALGLGQVRVVARLGPDVDGRGRDDRGAASPGSRRRGRCRAATGTAPDAARERPRLSRSRSSAGGVEDGAPDAEHDVLLRARQRVEACPLGGRERTVEHLEDDADRGVELLAAAAQHRLERLERLLEAAERDGLVDVHDRARREARASVGGDDDTAERVPDDQRRLETASRRTTACTSAASVTGRTAGCRSDVAVAAEVERDHAPVRRRARGGPDPRRAGSR